jgi:hypothetical protein
MARIHLPQKGTKDAGEDGGLKMEGGGEGGQSVPHPGPLLHFAEERGNNFSELSLSQNSHNR